MSQACAEGSCSAVPSAAACRLLLLAAPHSVRWVWESDVWAAERQLTRSGRWSSSAAGRGFHIPCGREEGGALECFRVGKPWDGGWGLSWARRRTQSFWEGEGICPLEGEKNQSSRPSLSHTLLKISVNFYTCVGPSSPPHLHAQALFGEPKLRFLHTRGVVCSILREQLLTVPLMLSTMRVGRTKEGRTQDYMKKPK